MEEYKEEYLDGMIAVFYHPKVLDLDGEPPVVLGGLLGYEVIDPPYKDMGDFVIHKTPVGEEDKVIEIFKAETRFVESADRIDKKFYETLDQLEEGVDKVQEIRDSYPIPDDKFNSEVEKIIQYFQSLKK